MFSSTFVVSKPLSINTTCNNYLRHSTRPPLDLPFNFLREISFMIDNHSPEFNPHTCPMTVSGYDPRILSTRCQLRNNHFPPDNKDKPLRLLCWAIGGFRPPVFSATGIPMLHNPWKFVNTRATTKRVA